MYNNHTRLNWLHNSVGIFPPHLDIPLIKAPLQYFLLMFPMQQVDLIFECTNELMERWRRGHSVTKQELFRYFGLRLAMTLDPRSTDDGIDIY